MNPYVKATTSTVNLSKSYDDLQDDAKAAALASYRATAGLYKSRNFKHYLALSLNCRVNGRYYGRLTGVLHTLRMDDTALAASIRANLCRFTPSGVYIVFMDPGFDK